MQKLDRHGFVTLHGVYHEAKESIDKDLQELPIGVTKIKRITWRMFSKVMRLYFTIMFRELIKGYSFKWLNKFGVLRIVKTMCTRYNPSTYKVYTDNDGNRYSEKVKFDVNKYGGYWHFIFWDVGKKWRQYRFNPDIKHKRAFMEYVDAGFEYLDYSLFKDGKYASDTYIHKIK
jgi:hypothetical protein